MPRLEFNPLAYNPVDDGGFGDTASSVSLLNFVGCVVGSQALVVSRNGLDLMCRLLRQGCAAATTLRPYEHCDHEAFDLVLVPDVGAFEAIDRLVRQANRALVPGGRLFVVASADLAGLCGDVGGLWLRSIDTNGFVEVRTRKVQGQLLIRADLPKDARTSLAPSRLQAEA